jgi:hypothetical protein
MSLTSISCKGQGMQRRGIKFWHWADCLLPATETVQRLEDGTQLDVRARISRESVTQLFIGVYKQSGAMVAEEFYADCADENLTQALAWGLARARFIFNSVNVFVAPHRLNERASQLDHFLTRATTTHDSKREHFMQAVEDARFNYHFAKDKFLQMMRTGELNVETWAKCRSDLNDAIDYWITLSKLYAHTE